MTIRVPLDRPDLTRTCRPLYAHTQATPHEVSLDPDETKVVYSGMVATLSGTNTVRRCVGGTDEPFGIFAMDHNEDLDDLEGMGDLRLFAVWQGGPDAEFEITAPAFDTTDTWAMAADGQRKPVYAGLGAATGKLTTDVNGEAVGELLEVISATRIRVRLHAPGTAA